MLTSSPGALVKQTKHVSFYKKVV